MKIFAKSDVGKAREVNQDSYYVSRPSEDVALCILADGMGGYNGGEIASKLAIVSAKNYIESNFAEIEHNKETILKLIKDAIEYANMIVFEKSKEDETLTGMGTTIEICLIYNNRVFIGHIGDSRIYRIRKEFMRKLTTDHSYVQKLIKEGKITKEEALNHPKKHMITRALGCTSFVEPDITVKGFQKGDILVITSDGLTNMVSDEEIFNVTKENIETSVERLVQMANDAGGIDNITTIIIINN